MVKRKTNYDKFEDLTYSEFLEIQKKLHSARNKIARLMNAIAIHESKSRAVAGEPFRFDIELWDFTDSLREEKW